MLPKTGSTVGRRVWVDALLAAVLTTTLTTCVIQPPLTVVAPPTVLVDGSPLVVAPLAEMVDGQVMVPVRPLAAALGAQVTWAETRAAWAIVDRALMSTGPAGAPVPAGEAAWQDMQPPGTAYTFNQPPGWTWTAAGNPAGADLHFVDDAGRTVGGLDRLGYNPDHLFAYVWTCFRNQVHALLVRNGFIEDFWLVPTGGDWDVAAETLMRMLGASVVPARGAL